MLKDIQCLKMNIKNFTPDMCYPMGENSSGNRMFVYGGYTYEKILFFKFNKKDAIFYNIGLDFYYEGYRSLRFFSEDMINFFQNGGKIPYAAIAIKKEDKNLKVFIDSLIEFNNIYPISSLGYNKNLTKLNLNKLFRKTRIKNILE